MQTIFHHAGYDMRSHSETRWAAVMDALSITWLYEPRVISTRHGAYLPDFYLPAAHVFIEVKGAKPNQVEREKAIDTEARTGAPVIFAHGRPEIIGAELFHGMLTYFTAGNPIEISTADIGRHVLSQLGEFTHHVYVSKGAHRPRPTCFQVSDLLPEIMTDWMTRGQLENYKRAKHSPLNTGKSEQHRVASKSEFALAGFSTKTAEWRSEKDAA